ncbi:hypothetical protein Tco_0453607 [Tanacetum coccineum]
MLTLRTLLEDQGRSAVHPLGGIAQSASLRLRVYSPLTRTHVRLLGRVSRRANGVPWPVPERRSPKQPDSQTAPRGATGSGHDGALTLSGAPFQGTWARSVTEDASPDYNSDSKAVRFSYWAVPGSLAVTKGILFSLAHIVPGVVIAPMTHSPCPKSKVNDIDKAQRIKQVLNLTRRSVVFPCSGSFALQGFDNDPSAAETPTSPRSNIHRTIQSVGAEWAVRCLRTSAGEFTEPIIRGRRSVNMVVRSLEKAVLSDGPGHSPLQGGAGRVRARRARTCCTRGAVLRVGFVWECSPIGRLNSVQVNTGVSQIANTYREGTKMKRTLNRGVSRCVEIVGEEGMGVAMRPGRICGRQ